MTLTIRWTAIAVLGSAWAASAAEFDWCKDYGKRNASGLSDWNRVSSIIDSDTISRLASGACREQEQGYDLTKVREKLAVWSKALGFNDTQLRESMALYANEDTWEKEQERVCKELEESAGPGLAGMAAIAPQLYFAGCKSLSLDAKQLYSALYDNPGPTPLAVGYRIATCTEGVSVRPLLEESEDRFLRDYGQLLGCVHDLNQFDLAAFEGALQKWSVPGLVRTMARERVYAANRVVKLFRKRVASLSKKDSAYQTILVTAPQAAYDSFSKAIRDDQAHWDAALDVLKKYHGTASKAERKKLLQGCEQRLRPAVEQRIARVTWPGTFQTFPYALLGEKFPTSYRLLESLVLCHAATEEQEALLAASDWYEGNSPLQGPAQAAFLATVRELAMARADHAIDQLADTNIFYASGTMAPVRGSTRGRAKAVVASLKPEGSGVRVQFADKPYQVPILDCVETGKIDRIAADGKLIYRQNCKVKGWEKRRVVTDPVVIPRALVAGLAPGVLLEVAHTDKGRATPSVAFKNDKPVLVSGFKLAP